MRQKRVFFVLGFAALMVAIPVLLKLGQSGATANNDTLAGYWKFDETIATGSRADSSGDSHSGGSTGTVVPQPSTSVPTTSYPNARSLDFSAINSVVTVNAATGINDLNNLSISAWINPDNYGPSDLGRIFDKSTGLNGDGWTVYFDGGRLAFYAKFTTSALAKISTATIDQSSWSQIVVAWDGTTAASGVKMYVNGTELTAFDTATDGVGTRVSDASQPLLIGNSYELNKAFDGHIDDVRLYSRVITSSEASDLANGNHPLATWTGSSSTDYETAGNWDINAVPDPYSRISIPSTANKPVGGANIAIAGLAISAGGRLSLNGYNLTMNDNGAVNNSGTLQLKNTETLTNFVNDTDSGTVLIRPDSDTTGLKTGNGYNNLILNDSTFAHWKLDEPSGSTAADSSGFEKSATYQSAPAPSTDTPGTKFADNYSLLFDGNDDYLSIASTTIPNNATWCAWVKLIDGNALILGSPTVGQYAMAITNSGTQVEVQNAAHTPGTSWSGISSLYGAWHNLCIAQTTTVTASLTLYVDGISQGSSTLSNGAGEISTIGGGGDYNTHGYIDDVRIYSRALSGTEIGRIAAGNQPATGNTTVTLGGNLDVNGDLTVSSGTLDASGSNYNLTLGGSLYVAGGSYNARSNTVTLDGGNQTIASTGTFYNLTKAVSSAATLTFGRSSTTTVTHSLSLSGASGNLLSLRSSTPGTQWRIDPQDSVAIDYLDLQDSNNINASAIDITDNHTTDSGNNTNWTINVAPNDPASLGGPNYVGGGWVNDNIPTVTFNLSDPNAGDQLRYHVQMSRTSDFSVLDVDYISAPGSQGARSFQVGQSEIGDTCNTGCENLVDGDYYWRVKTIDDYAAPHESDYTTANGGAVAFKLDATGPTTPGTPTTSNTPTNQKPTWNWTGSTDSGIGLGSPIFTLQWSKDATFVSSISSTTTSATSFTHSSNLSDGTWYFRVRAVDALGNYSAWSSNGSTIIDTTGPTTPITPFTASPTNFNFPTWSWPAPTDSGVGLAATPYTIQYSKLSNYTGGTTVTDTSATNSYAHTTGLSDGTWYFRVRAVDALGNTSAYSSSGTVLIDTTGPTNPGQPVTLPDPTNDNTPTWNWDASVDSGVGFTGAYYTVQWSNIADFSMIGGSTAVSGATYTHGTDLTDGTWYFRVKSKDALNNQSGYSDLGTVTVDTVAPDKPATPTTTTPTNDDTPTWNWTEPSDTGVGYGITPYTIQWSQDADFNTITGSETLGDTTYTNSVALAEGTWYFRVSATDAANNNSAWSDAAEVYIDTTAPSVPDNVSVTTPIPDNTPTWIWDASSDSGVGMGTPPYEVQWSTQSDFSSGNFTDTASSNTYTHTTPLADGTWYFRVRSVDAVGNQSAYSTAGQQTIDNNPPTTPGTPTTTTPSADNTPAWNWTASSDAGSGLDPDEPYIIEWSTASDFTSNSFSDIATANTFTHTTPLADGTWYFRVRAQDAVTNLSSYSGNGTVVVDATVPTTPGTPTTATPTTDSTPTFTWTAATDSGVGLAATPYVVELSTANDFSTDFQSATSTGNSFTPGSDLADGTWYIRVRAKDVVNNTSADSATGNVYIDDTAPSVPGTPTTETPTNNNTPTWEWSVSTDNGIGLEDPAYELQWSQDNTFGSGVQTDTINTAEYTHGATLADGTWYFRVRAVDQLTNTSAYSTAGSVIVSTAGPSVPGTPTTTTPTSNNLPAWTWSASSSLAGLANPAYSIEWSQDASFNTDVSAETVNSAAYTHVTPLADGTWYIRIRAEDQTGMFSAYSSSGSVFIDTSAPDVPTAPTTTTPTADNTPAWDWPDSTDSGVGLGSPAYTVEWSQDNTFGSGVSSATATGSSYTHASALTEGTWYIRARAKDGLNNTSAFSSNGSVVIDTSGPSAPGTPTTTTPTADNTPTWSWSASSDPGGTGLGTPAYEVQWSKDSGFGSGVSSGTSNTTSFTPGAALSDGTWYFRVRANDAVGNHSSYSGLGNAVVDTTAPQVPGTPSAGNAATNDATPTWTWSASSDAGGTGLGSPAYELQWSQDNTFNVGVSSATATGTTYTHGTDLAEGTWYFRVRAKDAVNNQSAYSTYGSVVVDTDVPTVPGTPDTSPSPTSNTKPTWTWDPSSDGGFGFGDDPYTVQWSKDATFTTGVSSASSPDETFTHSAALSDGTWHFRVKSVDDAGNESGWSASGTVVVDATGPSTPGTPDTDTPTKSPLPEWTWTVSTDSGVGLASPAYELQWSKDAGFNSGVETDTANSGSFTHTTPLSDGFWHFRVRAHDTLGNASAWASAVVSVDNTPPVPANISATPTESGATITWTTDEAASSIVNYSVGAALDLQTDVADTSPRVTTHSVEITGASACVTIQYQVSGDDVLLNMGVGPVKQFTTSGCSGNAQVATQAASTIDKDNGGSVSLASGTANIALAVPANFGGDDAEFQVKQLVTSTALAAVGAPAGRSLVGNHLYDLKAVSAPDVLISHFDNAVTVAMIYGPTEITGFDTTSLAIFRHDGGSWQQLQDCTTNTATRTVTCKTPGFSVFGLFGKAYVPVTPAPDPVVETPPDPEPVIKPVSKPSTSSTTGKTQSATSRRNIGTAISSTIRVIRRNPGWVFTVLVSLTAIAILGFITYKRRQKSKPHYGVHRDD